MAVSTYLRDQRLAHYRGTQPPAVVTFYLSLHSADPGLTGANELSGNAYARIAVTANTTNWGAISTNGSVRQIANAVVQSFAAASGAWTTATHFGLWDALTTGNFYRGAALSASKTVASGDTASFAVGDLVLNET